MEQYVIKGGTPLKGSVNICGAKNAALALIPAALLTEEPVVISNLPDVSDINILLDAIAAIGARVERINRHKVRIVGATVSQLSVDYGYVDKIRASYYLLGSLLGRFGEAEVAMPGGCVIGARPIDQHIKGFEALGAKVLLENGQIKTTATQGRLKGNHIYFDVVSVGATINIILAAVMAEGNTIIENPAKEPHVVDLANMLNSMGASIRGAGTDVIRIKGVDRLHKTEYTVIPDQIEAGTFMFAAAVTGGDVTVKKVIPKHLESITSKLVDIGCEVMEYDDSVRVVARGPLRATQVKTLPYPGFPTDMQPQMTAALTLAQGLSTVTESIFENRFKYTGELNRMGAKIKVEGSSTAIITGVKGLQGAHVSAPDLRAGAALVLAGLAADGYTEVDDIKYINRGYENFHGKLQGLGASIVKVESEEEIERFKKMA
ncbi:MAG: UDP-N-acetylglucosamine 1-carboxyvinyltransferase [Lachnospiraceae bacterium]|nr:UDP-N-acetylglucosamine 1-carboxyvinyltransferase [Lachnospiraceae bacterium]